MLDPRRYELPKEQRFGVIYESQSIMPKVYVDVERVISDYALVFTHSSHLLGKFPNTRWIPGSGTWVGGTHSGGEIKVHEKTKMISILTSNKMKAPLHRKRYAVARYLKIRNSRVDTFIQPLFSKRTISVLDSLSDYRYSICFENYIDDSYFTEKLLNCFATGTIPIYFGARDVTKYFDGGGILQFRNFRELRQQLARASAEDYIERIPAIKRNLELTKDYGAIEDFILKQYMSFEKPQ